MTKTNFFKKSYSFFIVKQEHIKFNVLGLTAFCIVCLFSVSSCGNSKSQDANAQASSDSSTSIDDSNPAFATMNLRHLQLTKSQLTTLINDTNRRKVIFQFLFRNNGVITLGAWSKKQISNPTDPEYVESRLVTLEPLQISKPFDTPIFLGDQDILVSELAQFQNMSNSEYLEFIPDQVSSGSGGKKHIYYKIIKRTLSENYIDVDSTAVPLPLILNTNPSPPKNAKNP